MACKYNDCGFCYAPKGVVSNSVNGECRNPSACPFVTGSELAHYKAQCLELQHRNNVLESKIRRMMEIGKE